MHQGGDEWSVETHRYPFAGKANAKVRLGLIAASGGETKWLELAGKDEDFYLARVGANLSPEKVARALSSGPLAQKFVAATQASPSQRGLTALNLAGLRLIEAVGASLIAALGVAVLGAFLVLERRREFAILQTIGAETRQILAAPAAEGGAVVLASLTFGIPIGIGLGMLAVKVLGLFFALKPPLLTLPLGGLAAMSAFVIVTSGLSIGLSLLAVTRTRPASILRAP